MNKMILMLLSLCVLSTAERTHVERSQQKKKKFISPPRSRPLRRKDFIKRPKWIPPPKKIVKEVAKTGKKATKITVKKVISSATNLGKDVGVNKFLKTKQAQAIMKSIDKSANFIGKFTGTTQTGKYYYYQNTVSASGAISSRSNWMSMLSDDTKFTQISFPGTHDTMTYSGCLTIHCQCQAITLQGQLESGIRALDVRCGELNHNRCRIYHGPEKLDTNLDDVLGTIQTFLRNHPRELVFMRLKDEHSNGGLVTIWNNHYRDKYKDANGDNIVSDQFIQLDADPRLGDVRGKIMVSFNGGWGTHEMQDYYNVFEHKNLYKKWNRIKDLLTKSKHQKNAGKKYVNHLSGTSTMMYVSPWFVASGYSAPPTYARCEKFLNTLNKHSDFLDFPKLGCVPAIDLCAYCYKGMNLLFGEMLKRDTSPNNRYHTGIILMDFPGKDLIDLIINQNDLVTSLSQSIPKSITLSRNNRVATIPNPPNEFVVSFNLHPTSTVSGWGNIIKLTSTSGNWENYGDRWLAIWFWPGNYRLHVVAGTTTDSNQNINIDMGIQQDSDNWIRVKAIGSEITVYVNDTKNETQLLNENRPQVSSLDVYASDSFSTAATATVEDLSFFSFAPWYN